LKQVTDEQLIGLARDGDKQAFGQLMQRYEKELFNFLVKFMGQRTLAEDAFQETFLQVHISASSFDTQRRFRPWLYTIAANKARDLLRSKARRPAMQLTTSDDQGGEVDLWHNLLRDETTPQDILEQKQQKELVREMVAKLPEHLREILVLAYFNQLPYKEIAQVLGIPLGTVKSRLHAAVSAFARKYNEITEVR
jgi:RNA polymerase sigma-70 factor (ECF subfamily)